MKKILLITLALAACKTAEDEARHRFQSTVGSGSGRCITQKGIAFCSDGKVLVICVDDNDLDSNSCMTVYAPTERPTP